MKRISILTLCIVLFATAIFAAELNRDAMKNMRDLSGGKDHPMISRVPDSWIVQYESKEFDEVELLLGPATEQDKFEKTQRVEGKVTRIGYGFPESRSTHEVIQSYLTALKQAGYKTLFSCNAKECGNWFAFNLEQLPGEDHACYYYGCDKATMRYAVSKLERPEGDVYVVLAAFLPVAHSTTPVALVRVIEVKPLNEDLVTVNAATMAKDIHSEGHIALYGIYFDFNKADIKPESNTTLQQIAKLLKDDSQLNLFVVGHTDSEGTLPYNMDLSQRRSESVVRALVSNHGIATKRLAGRGVGPLAPVASNSSDDGRARNRRVELVKQ